MSWKPRLIRGGRLDSNQHPDQKVAPQSDEQRVTAVVGYHAGDVLAYLERRTTQPQDAADVLADTLVTVWRRAADLPQNDTGARMWLFTIARNTLANHHRGQRRAADLSGRLREEVTAVHRRASMAGDDDPLAQTIADVIAELPDKQQELVTLVHWDGFSITDAATVLGINASTARGRYSTAREHLRRRLSDTPTGPPRAQTAPATPTNTCVTG